MIQANVLEQLIIFYNTLINNKSILAISIVAFASLLCLVIASVLKNKKIVKIIYLILYSLIFGYLIFNYHKEILNLLDYLMNNIFIFLFFPNLAVYILVLIITNILIVKSTISFKESKIKKFINIICFIIFNLIFYLIVNNIINNNVNIYEQLSIYTNSNLLNLIELSMKLFIVWITVLLLIKIINKINNYTLNRKNIKLVLAETNLVIPTLIEGEVEDSKISEVKEEIKKDYLEIIPNIEVQKDYNIYNDYINIEPIKKHQSKEDMTINKIENNIEENIFINKELKNAIEEDINFRNDFNDLQIAFDDEFKHDNLSNLKDNQDFSLDKEVEKIDLVENSSLTENINLTDKTDLIEDNNLIENNDLLSLDELSNNIINVQENTIEQSQDNVENEDNFNINLNSYDSIFEPFSNNETVEKEMPNIFSTTNNYLQSIIFDIEKLKNNNEDKNQIKEVYDKILVNEDNLSLNDYNYLINCLLDIKK